LNAPFPRSIDVDTFLADYWQKKIFIETAVVEQPEPALDADEIAWLATQPDVESRLVFTECRGDRVEYRLEQGPFEPAQLSALPAENWTLLVQDVEKHLPDFRCYFELVDFIPAWRIDDLMVSVAAPGGSVGPHRDHYDVFLLQGNGKREWRLGDPAAVTEDASAVGLALLEPFEALSTCKAATGDILYLPPGLPHWGVAASLCTTWSIGMRAPTHRELHIGAERLLDRSLAPAVSDGFYVDPDLQQQESLSGGISQAAVKRIRQQGLLDPQLSDAEIATVLGAVVTDPKAWLMPEPVSTVSAGMPLHGMAHTAWYEGPDCRFVFLNGMARPVDPESLDVLRECLLQRRATAELLALEKSAEGAELIEWLRRNSLFDPDKAGK
jgi:50S ribosomal protein L16 3-hydroxylase